YVQPSAQPGKQGLLQSQLAAEGIDGRGAKLRGKVEELPIKRARALQCAERESVHGKLVDCGCWMSVGCGLFKLRQNAVAHLSGRSLGKGDSNDMGGVVHLGKQAQKAARKQVRLAG